MKNEHIILFATGATNHWAYLPNGERLFSFTRSWVFSIRSNFSGAISTFTVRIKSIRKEVSVNGFFN